MDNDLISRKALKAEVKAWLHDALDLRTISEIIDSAPVVDAVEVVRCVDCKHSAIDAYANRRMCVRNGEIRPNGRIWFGVAVDDSHYCAYGVKMGGGEAE